MARKIRFPLNMADGANVRTIEELKEHFDLESVLGYFTDGKLKTWLEDRYYDEQAAAVGELSSDMPDLNERICSIFGIEYKSDTDVDLEVIQRKKEKLRILSNYTADREILDNIDFVAMDQDELFDILDGSPEKVYLYDKILLPFTIPFGKKNVQYIGINNPTVKLIDNKTLYDYNNSGITFTNIIVLGEIGGSYKNVEDTSLPSANVNNEQSFVDSHEIFLIRLAKLHDVVNFGRFKWYVTNISSEGCTLLCTETVTEIEYFPNPGIYYTEGYIGWRESPVRNYLNSDFYNDMFTDEEKSFVILSKCENHDIISNDQFYTEDYIYILNDYETKSLPSDIRHVSTEWWIRSEAYAPNLIGWYVGKVGCNSLTYSSNNLYENVKSGVRPVLQLKF